MDFNHDVPNAIQQCLQQFLSAHDKVGQCWLAYSGGLDSQVLLESVVSLGYSVKAIHVHHGINPKADSWVHHCQKTAEKLQIELQVVYAKVAPIKGQSLEETLRNARYQYFIDVLQENDVLLTAHHQDDQAETFLLRLLRGSGVKGLSCMAPHRRLGLGILLRPLLTLKRSQIEGYAKFCAMSWITDDSNSDERFDRNYVRHQVLPILTSRWPNAVKVIARCAKIVYQTQNLLEEYCQQDLTAIQTMQGKCVSISKLTALSSVRQAAVLRLWLEQQHYRAPMHAQLLHIIQDVLYCAEDKNPTVRFQECAVHRYRDNLYVEKISLFDPAIVIAWDMQNSIELPFELGTLSVMKMKGRGLKQPHGKVTIRFRQTGERIHPHGRQGSHPLKKLFQEWGIPPWRRDKIPLIFYNDECVAVVGYCICEGWLALEHEIGLDIQMA